MPTPSQHLETRIQTVCLLLLAAIAGAGALYWLRPVLIPFVLAIFVALGLGLLLETLITRLRVPRALALPAAGAIGLLAFLSVGALISASASQLAASGPVYSGQLRGLVERTTQLLPPEVEALLAPGEGGGLLANIPVSTVGGVLASTTHAILGLLSQSLLVLIFVLFLMLGGMGTGHSTGTWAQIQTRVQSYLVTKLLVSAVTGVLVGAVLGVLGVPLAMVFGLFAFLLNFIPSVGSVISTLLPLPVVIVSPEVGSASAALAIALPAVIQFSVGNLVEPKLMGDSLQLHPVAILISLIFWGMLWGIVGMLLATPITAVLRILLEKFEGTRPLADLMAGGLTRGEAT